MDDKDGILRSNSHHHIKIYFINLISIDYESKIVNIFTNKKNQFSIVTIMTPTQSQLIKILTKTWLLLPAIRLQRFGQLLKLCVFFKDTQNFVEQFLGFGSLKHTKRCLEYHKEIKESLIKCKRIKMNTLVFFLKKGSSHKLELSCIGH